MIGGSTKYCQIVTEWIFDTDIKYVFHNLSKIDFTNMSTSSLPNLTQILAYVHISYIIQTLKYDKK